MIKRASQSQNQEARFFIVWLKSAVIGADGGA